MYGGNKNQDFSQDLILLKVEKGMKTIEKETERITYSLEYDTKCMHVQVCFPNSEFISYLREWRESWHPSITWDKGTAVYIVISSYPT